MTTTVPVDWAMLELAFDSDGPEVQSYLHRRTGELLTVSEYDDDREAIADRIEAEYPQFAGVDPPDTREQWEWMADFASMVADARRRAALDSVLRGKGAFRRFKDALTNDERQEWFRYRNGRMREAIEEWLEAEGITPATPPPWGET